MLPALLDHPGPDVAVLRRQAVLPHVGVLDDVVVDRDDLREVLHGREATPGLTGRQVWDGVRDGRRAADVTRAGRCSVSVPGTVARNGDTKTSSPRPAAAKSVAEPGEALVPDVAGSRRRRTTAGRNRSAASSRGTSLGAPACIGIGVNSAADPPQQRARRGTSRRPRRGRRRPPAGRRPSPGRRAVVERQLDRHAVVAALALACGTCTSACGRGRGAGTSGRAR